MTNIIFNLEEFKDWLTGIGCDCCQYFPKVEGSNIVHNWEAWILGKITYHRDIELEGELEDDS